MSEIMEYENIYDNEDNDWIGINNNFGEWYICYLVINYNTNI